MAWREEHLEDLVQLPTGRLGVWWVVVSEIVMFGGLIACYIMFRLRHPEWANYASHTSTPAGALNTFVLLTSSLSIVLAHQAAEAGDLTKSFRYIWCTIGGGGIFLLVKAYEWTTEISHGYTFFANNFWTFYYTATGLHGLRRAYGNETACCRSGCKLPESNRPSAVATPSRATRAARLD